MKSSCGEDCQTKLNTYLYDLDDEYVVPSVSSLFFDKLLLL